MAVTKVEPTQKEEIEKIILNYIKEFDLVPRNFLPQNFHQDRNKNFELLERIIRVEKETKHLRKDLQEGFARMDKRFEQVDKRFAIMTKRIDRFMIWSFGINLIILGILLVAIRYYSNL